MNGVSPRSDRRARLRLAGLWLAALAWLGCDGIGKVAGGGGMETGNGSSIAGILSYPNGQPAAGAAITLRPKGYLRPPALPKRAAPSLEAVADANGGFTLTGLDTGSYLMEAADPQANGLALECRLDKPGARLQVQGRLTPTGTIRGSVAGLPSAGKAYVQVYGLERLVAPDTDGAFTLTGMPEGVYVLRVAAASPALNPVDLPKVRVQSAAYQDIGPVDLPPKGCGDFACDSLQVRALLDSNGLFTVTVTQVARSGSSPPRIAELALPARALVKVPDGIGKLEFLTKLDLSDNLLDSLPASLGALRALRTLELAGNRLGALPAELGKLAALANLNVKQNRLAALPPELGRLRALEFLDAQGNLLTDLPAGLAVLGPLILAVDGNHLCALAPATAKWVLDNEPDFTATSQTCP